MIKVINKNDVDVTKVVTTWQPIIAKLEIPAELQEVACLYADSHARIESVIADDSRQPSLLPLALKVFSKLNLKGKNVQLAPGPTGQMLDDQTEQVKFYEIPTFRVSTSLSATAYMDDRNNVVSVAEELLVNKMAEALNFNLRRYDTIVIYMLVNSLMTITAESTFAPKMGLSSRIVFFDRNKEPELLYEVSESDGVYSVSRLEDMENVIITKDDKGNEWAIDQTDKHASKIVREQALMQLAEEIEAKSDKLRNSATVIRQAIFK